MTHKQRGYKREIHQELLRDWKLFAIVCEGSKREPEYFSVFKYISSRIQVDIIEDIVSEQEMQIKHPERSAPKWVLDRAVKYIEKEGLLDEDELWFVMDIDKWSPEQLREIAAYCEQYPNWHIVLSNPCFEVWLYFHKRGNIKTTKSVSCQDFKNEISTFEKGGYHPYKFIPNLADAIQNAKAGDSNPDYFMPLNKETKVYKLGEALVKSL
ncbi:MAG: RloB domain-containing protein [Bacteroidales bacterium]|nr:RloB domain-containing protein [Bacteroidales bacterium]